MASELAAFQAVASAYSLNRAQAATYFVAVVLSTVPTSLGLDTNPNPSNPGGLSDQQTYINQFNAATNRSIVSGNYANQSATASNLNYPVVGPATNAGYVGGVNAESGVTNLTASVVTAENQIAVAAAANDPGLIPNVPTPGTTFQLTTGVDAPGQGAFTFGSPAGNSTTYGSFNGGTPTYTPGDNIQATGVNNTFNLSDNTTGGASANVNGVVATVSGIQTLSITSGEGITINSATGQGGFTGLTQLNVTSATNGAAGSDVITAAATTNVNVTDNSVLATAGAVTIDGGKDVAVTHTASDNGVATALGAVTVGATTRAAGTVSATVTETITNAAGPSTFGTIALSGTSGVTLTETISSTFTSAGGAITISNNSGATVVNTTTLNNATAGGPTTVTGSAITIGAAATNTAGTTVTVNESASANQLATAVQQVAMGAVTVNGGNNTTTVTVNQANVATGAVVTTAVAAVNGVNGVAAVTAAPGQNAVAAVTQVTTAAAVAGVATGTPTVTANGIVTIVDRYYNSTTANSIATVSLSGYGATSVIQSNALSSLTLGGTGGTLALTNATAGGATPTTTTGTLSLGLNALKTSAAGVSNAITVTNGWVGTLNITATGANSILGTGGNYNTTALTDANLTAVTLSGTGTLTMGAFSANPTTITVTGSAGYNGLINGTATTFNAAGTSGIINLGIGATPTKAITAGTAATDTIVLTALGVADSTTTTANYTSFNTNVTGFNQLGVAVTGGTWDMSKLTGTYTGLQVYNTTVWTGAAPGVTATFTKVAPGTSLTLGGTQTNAVGTIVYQSSDTSGATDSLSLTLAGGTTGFTTAALTVQDANSVGYGTINVTSNASTLSAGNTITAITDAGLTNLSLSGTGGLTFTNAVTLTSTSLTIANNSTMQPASSAAGAAGTLAAYNGSLTFTNGISDNTLGSITFTGSGNTIFSSATGLADTATNLNLTNSGTGKVYIDTYAAGAGGAAVTFAGSGSFDIGTMTTTATGVAITNNGTGSVWIGGGAAAGFTDPTLTSLTLAGQVQFGRNNGVAITAFGSNAGVTVAASTDNQHLNLNLTGALVNNTDAVTVGNGNNLVIDGSTAGTFNFKAGTGSNYVKLGGTQNTTLTTTALVGAHTAPDQFVVGSAGNSFATYYNTSINGIATGDVISFANDVASSSTALTKTTLTAYGTLAGAIGALETGLTAHKVAYGTWTDGNTYLVESQTGTAGAADTTVVQIIGNVTLTASNGFVTVGSVAANGAQGFHSVYGDVDTATLSASQSFTSYFNDQFNLTQAAGAGANVTLTGATSSGTVDLSAATVAGAATINVSSSSGAFTLKGGASADTISGGTGGDAITGNAANDALTGGGGADTFVYLVGAGATAANKAAANGNDTISDFATANDTLTVFGAANLLGAVIGTKQYAQGTLAGLGTGTNGDNVIVITDAQAGWTTAAAVEAGLAGALTAVNNKAVVIFKTSAGGAAQVWYDSDVNTDTGAGAGATQLITLTGVTDLTTFATGNFV